MNHSERNSNSQHIGIIDAPLNRLKPISNLEFYQGQYPYNKCIEGSPW